ncbi:MAG: hypothetical protein NWP69_04765 [Congregibacter sp.]|nr:hypothetical protein [Congregibacter sp.]MDP5069725.1 hypothetical protein [Congregibacter sp.]
MKNPRRFKRLGRRFFRSLLWAIIGATMLSLSACDDPHIYGSVGVSSGYGGYGGYYGGYRGWGGPRMHSSISIGGRIH